MSLPIVFRRVARMEFDDAADAYEQSRPGLGAAFSRNVQVILDRIAAMPECHRVVFADARRANLKRFPYSVIYQVEPTQIVILGVIHGSRDPSVWQSRL